MNISLFIDAWGTYYRQILSPEWIIQIARNCGCVFGEIILVQNNIHESNLPEYCDLMSARLEDGSISSAINSDRCAKRALGRANLKAEDFAPLLYQSLGDLVAIDRCPTDYMVYLSGDAVPWGRSNWVKEGIELLEKNMEFMIVNPTWNGLYEHARRESFRELDEYFLGMGFSDQCYLARTADLRADIYHETNADSDRLYCPEHGNTFEKRVNAHMRNHGRVRVTLKSACYITRP